MTGSRRGFLKNCSTLALGSVFSVGGGHPFQVPIAQVVIDPKPLFVISPYLYIQFMEPLGATDGSVEAPWDYDADNWRQDLVEVVRNLSPGLIRFGGLFGRYYRWRDGIGPVNKRPCVRNYAWGGKETTASFGICSKQD